MDGIIAPRRFNMALVGLLGVLGLGMAVVGIFSVMSGVVVERRHEIGVRLALGASPAGITGRVSWGRRR